MVYTKDRLIAEAFFLGMYFNNAEHFRSVVEVELCLHGWEPQDDIRKIASSVTDNDLKQIQQIFEQTHWEN